jgi:hypothetical protein
VWSSSFSKFGAPVVEPIGVTIPPRFVSGGKRSKRPPYSSALRITLHYSLRGADLFLQSCWHDMAASSMPIPVPPRTPTRPLDEQRNNGLGLEGMASATPPRVAFNRNGLSPNKPDHSAGYLGGGMSAPLTSSNFDAFYSPLTANNRRRSQSIRSDDGSGPFNFEPTALAKSPVVKSVCCLPDLSLKETPPFLVPSRKGN